jgi:hypothetical protein
MATYTTRNDLIKPEYTDMADVKDFNDNMDFIDGSIAPCSWDKTSAPTANDDVTLGYIIGSMWFDVTNHKLYICEDNTDTAAVWRLLYPQAPAGVLLANGTVPLTAAWDAGSYQIRAETFQSDVATGTAPFTVASTTRVSNLNAATCGTADSATNADTLDTLHSTSFAILDGQSKGQTLYGGTAKDESLSLYSNSNGATGYINMPNANLVIGTKATTAPNFALAIHEGAAGVANPIQFMDGDGSTVRAAISKSSADALDFCAGDGTTVDVSISGSTGVLTCNYGVYSVRTLTNPTTYTTGITNSNSITYTGTADLEYYGLNSSAFPIVAATKTNNSGTVGLINNVLRNSIAAGSDDDGTLGILTGQLCQVGHGSTNTSMKGTTTTVYGMRVIPYCGYGTITSLYNILINDIQGAGTVTNKWGIYNGYNGVNYTSGTYNRFQTTSGDRVIYVVQTSATDPIADAWNTHSNEKYKNDLGVIDHAHRSARYFDRQELAASTMHVWTRKADLEDPSHYEAMFPLEVPVEGVPQKDMDIQLAEQEYAAYKHIAKCKTLPKFQKQNIGMFAEDAPEEIVSYSLDGKPEGIDLGAYIGWVHNGAQAIHQDLDAVELDVADLDYMLWEKEAEIFELRMADAESQVKIKVLESKCAALLAKHDDAERRMAKLEARLSKLEKA